HSVLIGKSAESYGRVFRIVLDERHPGDHGIERVGPLPQNFISPPRRLEPVGRRNDFHQNRFLSQSPRFGANPSSNRQVSGIVTRDTSLNCAQPSEPPGLSRWYPVARILLPA